MEAVKTAINEAIANIENEISELTIRRETLQNLDNLPISDAEKWCLLCETPLRANKEGMLYVVEKFIPGADKYLYDVNCIKVCMGRIIVSIPTTKEREINLFYDGMIIRKYPEMEEPNQTEKFLKGYISLLEQNVSTYTLLKYCFPKANFFGRFINYLLSDKKELRNIEAIRTKYNKLFNERQARANNKLDAYNTFANEVCRFDALLYNNVKSFASDVFKIKRNSISY